MKRLIFAALLAFTGLIASGPTSLAMASATTSRPVVFEPTASHPKSAVKPSHFVITVGPGLYAKRVHWTSWGRKTATGTGKLYGVDSGTQFLGHATIHLYAVRTHRGTLYYSKLRLTHQHGSVPDYIWSWPLGSWEG
jgi:hypothetical protein